MSTTREDQRRAPAPRGGRPSQGRGKGAVAVVLSLLMLFGLGAGAYFGARSLVGGVGSGGSDFQGEGDGTVTVTINKGEGAPAIGRTLKAKGVVKTVQAFVDAAREEDKSTSFQPGAYNLREQMSASAALAMLLDPDSRAETKVVIPEGLRVTEIVAALSKQTDIPKAQFEKALESPKLGLPDYAKGKPEGMLFPATYPIPQGENALQILQRLVTRQKQEIATLGLDKDGRDAYKIITVASMLEKEVNNPADFGKAARVAQNRLDRGMPLGFDSALHYFFGDDTPLTTEIIEHQEVDNPYNLRRRPGLPPTPISNPGSATLKAALNPTPGDWTYFLTIDPKTGKTLFFDNNRDFVNAKNKYDIDY